MNFSILSVKKEIVIIIVRQILECFVLFERIILQYNNFKTRRGDILQI